MYPHPMALSTESREPGGRDPAPEAELQLVQEFVNTVDLEGGHDSIGTPQRLREWLVAQRRLGPDEPIDGVQHARALAVREGLRALGHANNGEPLDPERLAEMNRAAATVPMVASLSPAGWRLQPAASGVDRFLAHVLASVLAGMADGSWSRMKACRNDACRWLFFDHSRNRSGTWCTMSVCGSRMKARAYRARQRQSAGA